MNGVREEEDEFLIEVRTVCKVQHTEATRGGGALHT